MSDQPTEPDTPVAVPADPPHMLLVERVASIEDTLTQLMARHNAFVNTVVKELGL